MNIIIKEAKERDKKEESAEVTKRYFTRSDGLGRTNLNSGKDRKKAQSDQQKRPSESSMLECSRLKPEFKRRKPTQRLQVVNGQWHNSFPARREMRVGEGKGSKPKR
jgi:hypothetical protein